MHRGLLTGFCLVTALLGCGSAVAGASLFIYPTLVLFEGNNTSAVVTIANRGDEMGTFEISFSNMSMTAEGGLAVHEEEVPWSIQPFLRYSPRRATLAPGESQVIRIALRRDASIPEAEYYSHMRVLTLNSEDVNAADADESSSNEGVSITARSAIAIPVIWRNSQTAPAASIRSAVLNEETHSIAVDIAREGTLSTRGFIHLLADGDGAKSATLADPIPVILYPSVDSRTVDVPLPEGMSPAEFPEGFRLVYSEDEELLPDGVVYATAPVSQAP